ncbi:spore coat protein U-like protein [Luteimonas cucumeris]|uniref:Spore coat protein U-like protein n=1 Tax=Luteimonas cucumeris TaxID=985012 RepID=A0A562LBI3_9GAMM|nr:spore coat protein U domain-containing protein [Luteimonas cucumeris]TWI04905.1 spore coat protein U-like protein [Luteimonas cucumeris]
MIRFSTAWLFAAALLAAGLPAPLRAAEVRATFQVKLEVGNVCTLDKGADVDFGTITPSGSHQTYTASGSLVVRCTLHTPYTIRLDGGLHGTVTDRKMRNTSGQTISYQLHSGTLGQCGSWNPAQWGDGSGGSCVFSATNHASEQTIAVAGQTTLSTAEGGAYSDTVTATITY